MGLFGKKKKEKLEEKKIEKKEEKVETTQKTSSSKNTNAKSTKNAPAKSKAEKESLAKSEQPKKTGKKPIYRVLYDKEARVWVIKKDGAKRVIDSKHTKEEALARVNELVESQDAKYVVHKKDGKFQKKQ